MSEYATKQNEITHCHKHVTKYRDRFANRLRKQSLLLIVEIKLLQMKVASYLIKVIKGTAEVIQLILGDTL